ncbi:MAG: hypothetical protein CM1200mP22_17980 [Dehalococcoidia bacterium]|nr:MAG: hypothetical protein CM1200mP22_17980 [Dehalococcoidia bacterium]
MQSKNGGWAAFDKNNNKKYLTKIPFSDFGETLDPPSVDVTAHILEMYGKLGYTKDNDDVKRGLEICPQRTRRKWFLVWSLGSELHLWGWCRSASVGSPRRRHVSESRPQGHRLDHKPSK